MGAVLALGSAVSFGIADVTGAVASRRRSSIAVAAGIQITGAPVLLLGLLLVPGTLSSAALLLGAAAGLAGNLGLALYLRSMAVGPIGVISPISAVVGAGVPVAWGVLVAGEDVTRLQALGIVAGLTAVVLVAWSPRRATTDGGIRGPALALLAGTLFGAFFIVLDATPADSGLWPLVASRGAGVLGLGVLLGATRHSPSLRGTGRLVTASGGADATANLCFLFATRSGLLSLVALLSSLYPVVALLLARRFLGERLRRGQLVGVALAVAATAALVA